MDLFWAFFSFPKLGQIQYSYTMDICSIYLLLVIRASKFSNILK